MSVITGFQINSQLAGGLWIYKPDPALDPQGKEIVINANRVQYFESSPDHSKVWIYYDQTNVSTSQAPYTLTGLAAQAFMNDVENLFSGSALKSQFDLGGSLDGSPSDGFLLLTFPFPTTVVFAAGLSNSQGVARIAPVQDAIFLLCKNTIPFGTMIFPAGKNRAVFNSGADVTFTLNPQIPPAVPLADVITIVSPNPADPNLTDLGFCLAGLVISS